MGGGAVRILRVLVCAACVVLVGKAVRPAPLVAALRQADPVWLAPALLALVCFLLLNAARWSVLLRPVGGFSVARLLRWQLIGYLGNTLLPLRAGDIGRGILAGNAGRGGPAAGLATIVVEKTADVLVLLAMLVVSIALVGPPPWVGEVAAIAAAISLCALLAVAVLAVARGHRPLRRAGPLASPLRLLEDAAAVIPAWRAVPPIAGLSTALWVASALNTWFVLRAAGVGVGFAGALLVTAGLNLALAIPSGPASLGSYEMAVIALVAALGFAPPAAQAAALAMRAAQYLPPTLLGVPALWFEGLRLGDLRRAAAERGSSSPAPLRPAAREAALPWSRS